jgi:hypothetical protein
VGLAKRIAALSSVRVACDVSLKRDGTAGDKALSFLMGMGAFCVCWSDRQPKPLESLVFWHGSDDEEASIQWNPTYGKRPPGQLPRGDKKLGSTAGRED